MSGTLSQMQSILGFVIMYRPTNCIVTSYIEVTFKRCGSWSSLTCYEKGKIQSPFHTMHEWFTDSSRMTTNNNNKYSFTYRRVQQKLFNSRISIYVDHQQYREGCIQDFKWEGCRLWSMNPIPM